MKSPVFVAAALAFAGFALPASASSTAPHIQLLPLGPAHVAVVSRRAGCDAPAAVVGTPFLVTPTLAALQNLSGTVEVKIDLTSQGTLAGSEIFASSGSRLLDNAALESAGMARYAPETVSCQRVGGSYLYEVVFE